MTAPSLSGESRTILLVDDEPSIVRGLEFGLRRRGFNVLGAHNGEDAFAIIQSPQSVDMLVSDVLMPGGISGLELARSSVELRPGLAVLLMTGYAYDLLQSLGARDDEFELVAKPITVSTLASRIDAILAGFPTRRG